jgi:nucleoside-diphosphate-sugar epimerase
MEFFMKKILITGNMGYIGPTVVRRLKSSYPSASLVGLDIGYFANRLTGAEVLPECNVDIQYFMDVRRVTGDLLKQVDAIVYLAAISNDPMGKTFENVTMDVNYKASIRLAEMAKNQGVNRFVFASSCSMYGAAEGEARREESPLNPLTAYAKSKVYAEMDLKKIAAEDFIITSLRFSTACGMSDRLRLDLVLNDFVASAVAKKKITILSDGTPWRPLIDVKDMAKAIDWAISRKRDSGGEFLAVNVGSNEWNYQVRDLAEAVAEEIPGVAVEVNLNAVPDKRSYRVCFDLFRRLAPNHQPEINLKDSVRNLRLGLELMQFNDPDFRNSNFVRLNVLNRLLEKRLINENLEWRR